MLQAALTESQRAATTTNTSLTARTRERDNALCAANAANASLRTAELATRTRELDGARQEVMQANVSDSPFQFRLMLLTAIFAGQKRRATGTGAGVHVSEGEGGPRRVRV